MNTHRGWFTLLMRATGIFLIVSTMSHGLYFVVSILSAVMEAQAQPTANWLWWILGELAYLIPFGVGLYLLFGGQRLVRYCLASVPGLCPECGFDRGVAASGPCPNCGVSPSAPASTQA